MRIVRGIFCLLFVLIAIPALSEDFKNEDCLTCHSDSTLTGKDSSGKEISEFVDLEKFKRSVHGGNDCVSCHEGISEIPHPESLPEVSCATCHSDQSEIHAASSHGKARAAKNWNAPDCATCHGKHDILPKSDAHSKTHPLHQIQICSSCHLKPGGAALLPAGVKERGTTTTLADDVSAYKNSIHGRGVLRSGLLVSATCVSCHTAHGVLPKSDPKSTTYAKNIPSTCGKCHLGILEDFKTSEHGKLWTKNSTLGPGCVTCHGSHGIADPIDTAFQLHIPLLCAKCHEKEAPTYQDSFHGKAVSLGFVRAATCADCHTSHTNLKKEDPKSTVHKNNLQKTCGECHGPVSASFVTFDPHANPESKEDSPLLYYVHKAMVLLLYGVFGFFTIHTLLWYQRSIVANWRGELKKHRQDEEGEWVMRFSRTVRIIHLFIIISFLGLAFTGIPIRFSYVSWTKHLVSFIGGIEVTRFLHRFFAVITFGYAFFYIGHIIHRIVIRKEYKLLYGPGSMVPRLKDFRDLFQQVRWFLYLGKPARLDRWTYWEKFDYFAVFWGIPVIGLSGLLLWFPRFFTTFLPGYMLNVAKVVHSEEAMLAVGFIFIFHFFHTHLRPESYPMDLVIFTGSMPLSRFKQERPEEYHRLVESGELEKYLVDPPSASVRRNSYWIGTAGLTIGVILIILILFSVLFFE